MPEKMKLSCFPWPKIYDKASAQNAIYIGVAAAIINAAILLIFVMLHKLNTYSLVTVVLLAIIGFFIYKRSRVAAVLGTLICATNILTIFLIIFKGGRASLDFHPILMLLYISGVRGTFGYHRFKDEEHIVDNAPAPTEFDIR
jgi:hypothetical protein